MPRHSVLTQEKLREIISLANRGLSRRRARRSMCQSRRQPRPTRSAFPALRTPPPQAPTRQQRPALRPTGNQTAPARPKSPSPMRFALSTPCSPLPQPAPAACGRLFAAGPTAQQAVPPGSPNCSTANRSTSNRSTANRSTSNRSPSNRSPSNRSPSNRPTSNRPTSNRPTSNRPTSNRSTSNRST
jgi:hypothetical protein